MRDNVATGEYSRADVRRILGISEQQLRGWQRQGLVPDSGAFTFSDVITLRTVQKLRDSGVPGRQISRAVESLRRKLAGIRHPLAELKVISDGRAISVHLGGGKMDAVSGQLLLDFDASEIRALKTLKTLEPKPGGDPRVRAAEAEAWFQRGLALEETGAPIEEAIEAYKKAIELNPAAAGALLNMGTIHYKLRRFKEAEDFYRRAVAIDPRYALAHFNLGNLYDEMGNATLAEEHYLKALEINPHYADAHFNVALLCEKRGDPLRALRHWKAYLKLDATTAWAEVARRQLARLRDAAVVVRKS